MGEILITRDYHELYSSQEFKIIIDGKEVNNIKNNKRKVISLPVGQHEMYIQVMGTKSPTKIVNIEPKKTLRFRRNDLEFYFRCKVNKYIIKI